MVEIRQVVDDTYGVGLTCVCSDGSEVCPTASILSTSVRLTLRALRGSPFREFAIEEIMTCVALLKRRIGYREAGQLHVTKQGAYSKLLGISLNNPAACETNVKNASLDEQSSKAERLGRSYCLFCYPVTHEINMLAVNSFRGYRAAPPSTSLDFHLLPKQVKLYWLCPSYVNIYEEYCSELLPMTLTLKRVLREMDVYGSLPHRV